MQVVSRPNTPRFRITRRAPFWIACALLGACAGSAVPTTQPRNAQEARALVTKWGVESEYPFMSAPRMWNYPATKAYDLLLREARCG